MSKITITFNENEQDFINAIKNRIAELEKPIIDSNEELVFNREYCPVEKYCGWYLYARTASEVRSAQFEPEPIITLSRARELEIDVQNCIEHLGYVWDTIEDGDIKELLL